MVSSILKGFHCTVFAYGQTGSGKTYTMEGYEYLSSSDNKNGSAKAPRVLLNSKRDGRTLGVVPTTIGMLFDTIELLKAFNPSLKVIIKASFVQIYKASIPMWCKLWSMWCELWSMWCELWFMWYELWSMWCELWPTITLLKSSNSSLKVTIKASFVQIYKASVPNKINIRRFRVFLSRR
jgi:hypothetical protein